ncbi:MAG: response regulator transcription factor [Roseobacter sp.]|uniref:response regulator transcription factor n=1 Tax=Tateyamaria sp. TaxID=1929288 RepID=UPI00327671BB
MGQNDNITNDSGTRVRKILIVDDHPLFCDALTMTLQVILPQLEEVFQAARFSSALHLASTLKPDVVLLDLNLPDVEGLGGLAKLLKIQPQTPVIVISSVTDNRIIRSCMRSGAKGFVPKHSDKETFQAAFNLVIAGGHFFPESYVEPAASSDVDDITERLTSLTNKQAHILELICKGRMNKQIAFELSIAETTVKAHVTAIMRKLGVQSRTQAVLIAQEASLSNLL